MTRRGMPLVIRFLGGGGRTPRRSFGLLQFGKCRASQDRPARTWAESPI